MTQSNPALHRPLALDPMYYVSLLLKHWLSISLFTILCTSLAVLGALSITPTYRAVSTVFIESSQSNTVSIEAVVGLDSTSDGYYQTQYEIMRSNVVARKVIESLNLTSYPEFNPALVVKEPTLVDDLKAQIKTLPWLEALFIKPEVTRSEAQIEEAAFRSALATFKSKLTILPVAKTQLVKIAFESESPQLAATISNQVGKSYIESNLDSKLLATEQATSWINEQLSELRFKLESSEQALIDFLQQQKLIDNSGIEALTNNELTNLTNQMTSATQNRVQAQSLYNALKDNQGGDLSRLTTIPEINNHPQIREVRSAESEAERNLAQLSKRYGPKHDKMIQAQAQLASAKQRSHSVISKVLQGLESDLRTTQARERLLKQEVEAKKAELQSVSLVRGQYDALKRDVDTNANIYDMFLTRQKETSATSDFTTANARISDLALIPSTPYKPSRSKIVMIAFIASLFGASLIVIVLDTFRKTITNMQDFQEKLGILPLVALPKVKAHKKNHPITKQGRNKAALYQIYTEKVDSLRTAMIINQNQEKYSNVTIISSSLPNEGKTSSAIQLARSFAKFEKVLLLDIDLRKPSIYKSFDISRSQLGITNYIHADAAFEECVVEEVEHNLSLAVSGIATASPQQTLNDNKFKQFIDVALSHYDRIIIDTPPMSSISDTLIVGSLIGHVTLVVKANSTKTETVQFVIDQLHRHKIKLSGTVLNATLANDARTEDYYYSYSR
jgi:capsular exopolysaccharide synthesis family protein